MDGFDSDASSCVLAQGACERVNSDKANFTCNIGNSKSFVKCVPNYDHVDVIKLLLDYLCSKSCGILKSFKEIDAIGHRVLHGGCRFSRSVLIDQDVKVAIRENFCFAPLHNPANLLGIETCESIIPDVAQVAVFDTAFHQNMSQRAFLYALPYEYYSKYNIRRYGFHGISHKYVSQRAADILRRSYDNFRINDLSLITCHLGNGASVCAIRNGSSVDTSMGLTPLEGLVMGTRCGDIDPAIINYLVNVKKMSSDIIYELLNKQSGMLGISGVSSDFRDIESAAIDGDLQSQIALDVFCYRCAKYIGSYITILSGVGAIVFTAGVGENSPYVRAEISKYFNYLGLKIDLDKNNIRGREMQISTEDSSIKVFVIPTDEELMIAKETIKILNDTR
jgi:acetate kinase